LVTRVCVSVCLSLASLPHYCTDPDVTWGNGTRCPLVRHYWADLQSVHGFRCYDNIARKRNVSECSRSRSTVGQKRHQPNEAPNFPVRHAMNPGSNLLGRTEKERKGRWYLYSTFKHTRILTKRSGMDHTVLPANNTMPAFPS